MLIGSGEHSTFIKVKKGEKVMLSDGTFVEAGLTPEESKRRLDDKIDDMLYSKPVALVKKISRRLKKIFRNGFPFLLFYIIIILVSKFITYYHLLA